MVYPHDPVWKDDNILTPKMAKREKIEGVFGRDIFSVRPEDAFESGRIASREGFDNARRYIERKYKNG